VTLAAELAASPLHGYRGRPDDASPVRFAFAVLSAVSRHNEAIPRLSAFALGFRPRTNLWRADPE
jgi:hypothetical protein